jgi:hypothetical protein
MGKEQKNAMICTSSDGSPFLHSECKTIYLAAKFNYADIFFTEKGCECEWVNIGRVKI